MESYLSASYFFDYEHPAIQDLIADLKDDDLTDQQKAVKIYLKIRDGWWYNAYNISFKPEKSKASWIANQPEGHCIDKSILLIACLRAMGIPARIHLAKVKNHIGVERLIEKLGTNELTPHGMVDIFLDGKWRKASPAFNKELCEKCNVEPLDFDGENDSLFQEFDKSGNTFMEYLDDYGHFEDLPIAFIKENMLVNYPKLVNHLTDQEELNIT